MFFLEMTKELTVGVDEERPFDATGRRLPGKIKLS